MSTFLGILIPEYGQSNVPFVWAFSNSIDRSSNEMHMWNNFVAHLQDLPLFSLKKRNMLL